MKILALLALFCGSASAVTITPYIPGMNDMNLTARSVVVEPNGQIYSSVPGMAKVRAYPNQKITDKATRSSLRRFPAYVQGTFGVVVFYRLRSVGSDEGGV